MADLKKTVEIIFGAKNEVSKVVADIGRNFETLGDLTGKVTAPLAKVGDSILKIDAAMAALAIGGMALAIKTAGNFNGKFGEITTLISDTGVPIAKFKEDVKNYAFDSVKSIDDITQAIYTAVSADVDYKDSIKFVNETEKLSVAGRSALGDTTKVLISVLNAYGQSTDKAGKYSDIMFTTVKLGLTTMTELSASLAQVTGLAANAGIPFETLSAAIAALTTTGMPTAQAITSIKAAIQNIIKPTKEAEETAQSLGLQFNAAALKTKGLEGVLWDAQRATGGNVEKMAQLFGSVEALNAVMVLASDKTGKFKSSLEEIGKSAGATQVAYDKVANEFENINQRLANNFKMTLVEIGEKLMPGYGKIAGAFGDLLKGIKIGVDAGAFDPLFAYLDQVSGSIAVWLKAVGAAFPEALTKIDFTGLIAAFNDLGRAIGDYFGGLDLTKANDLASAMQLLIDIVTGIVRVTAGMADAFRPFITVIVDFFKTLAAGGPETQETMGKILAFSMAIQTAGLAVVAAILAIDEFKISMTGLFNTIAGGTQVMWNGFEILLTAIKGMVIIVGGLFVELLDKLSFGMLPGLDTMKEKLTAWGSTIEASFIKNGTEAAVGLDRLGDGLMRLGSESGTSKNKVAELRKGLTELPAEILTKINLTGIDESQGKVTAIKKAVTELPDLKEISIKTLADGSTIEKAYGAIIQRFPDGQILLTNVGVEADAANLKKVQKKIDDAIPKDKLVEIQAKLDEAKIKEQSNIIQHSIEWKAKIDIAQVEAETARLKTMFDSINTSITSTGTTLASEIGSIASSVGTGTTGFIQSQIETEGRRRDEALLLQKQLIEAEVDVLKKQAEALEKGEGIIKIESSNLAPHLEAFMYEILKAIQVKANSEGMKFLVGI